VTDTSLEALQSVDRESIRNFIFGKIASNSNGMTCDEVERAYDLKHQTASARITELLKDGRIKPSGSYRKTRTGRNANVYVSAGLL
jgi:hypothetical protein